MFRVWFFQHLDLRSSTARAKRNTGGSFADILWVAVVIC